MFLLKFHFSFSILCLLTFIGFRTVFHDLIIKNGYKKSEKRKLSGYLIFFIPILNIISVFVLFLMIAYKEEDFYKLLGITKENNNAEM